MSAGTFKTSKYESNNGLIYSVRIQPETEALEIGAETNDPPAGAVDAPVRAIVSGSRRQIGCKCRKATMKFTGAVPSGYKTNGTVTVPLLTPAMYAAASVPSATGTYLGSAVEVIFVTPEFVK